MPRTLRALVNSTIASFSLSCVDKATVHQQNLSAKRNFF